MPDVSGDTALAAPIPELAGASTATDPDAVHVATEGPLGVRGAPLVPEPRRGLHDLVPHAVSRVRPRARADSAGAFVCASAPVPWGGGVHAGRDAVDDAATRSAEFHNLALWSRGVDTEIFRPRGKQFLDLPRPIWLYFGRIAVEKGVEDFLKLQLPGSKLVVGDGPATALLKQRFPQAHYCGLSLRRGTGALCVAADVFVFPSRTDTFGLVLLEAMACGVPVAAYPVTGPCDVVLDGVTGALSGISKPRRRAR